MFTIFPMDKLIIKSIIKELLGTKIAEFNQRQLKLGIIGDGIGIKY